MGDEESYDCEGVEELKARTMWIMENASGLASVLNDLDSPQQLRHWVLDDFLYEFYSENELELNFRPCGVRFASTIDLCMKEEDFFSMCVKVLDSLAIEKIEQMIKKLQTIVDKDKIERGDK